MVLLLAGADAAFSDQLTLARQSSFQFRSGKRISRAEIYSLRH
jgi:hypothetical protein